MKYIFNIILTLRCVRLHNAHWRIITRPLVITGMTKLTRCNLLQLEGSSRALPFCWSLTTWQVCDVRQDAGGHKFRSTRYDNSLASASTRCNPKLWRAAACNSLDILSFQSSYKSSFVHKSPFLFEYRDCWSHESMKKLRSGSFVISRHLLPVRTYKPELQFILLSTHDWCFSAIDL